mmetsp:Transcript_31637/g.57464  ORF Transcript_31637/g.57464 Transcript_31637/m.57464 type:complete len:228 (+) Transcript_31637:1875-2558(+)
MARTHMQRLLAALDCLATPSGVKLGSSMYFCSFLIVASDMLSLSNSSRLRMKDESLSTFLAVSQSGFSFFKMQTASMVSWTRGGGLGKDLISTMSFLLSAFKLFKAAFKAGMASAKSALALSAMTCVSACIALTSRSSAATTRFTFSACSWSAATLTSSSAVALAFVSRIGCRSANSIFIRSTSWLVSLSLLRPLSKRSLSLFSASRFSRSSLRYRLMRSKYDLGVV